MPRHSDRARGGRNATTRRVAQRDLRFNNVSMYAPAFLALFVFSFYFLISLSLSFLSFRVSIPQSTTVVPLLALCPFAHLFPFRSFLRLLASTPARRDAISKEIRVSPQRELEHAMQ